MSDIPFLKRRQQHKIGKAGRASEERLSKKLGGRSRPASGAMQGAKGDMAIGQVLVEAKSTTKDSLGLKYAWLAKISHEARGEAKTPALTVSFVRENGTPYLDGEWVMIPMHVWQELQG